MRRSRKVHKTIQRYTQYAIGTFKNLSIAKVEEITLKFKNQAHGLTPEEIDLMWKTAPPRMPIPNPNLRAC